MIQPYVPANWTQHYEPITSPIRRKAVQNALDREAEHKHAFSEAQTQRIPRVTAPLPRITRPMLPLDAQGVPYALGINTQKDTLSLIKSAVLQYSALQHHYPTIILLSPCRYLAIAGMVTHFQMYHITIPLSFDRSVYENLGHYDVLVK